MSQAVKTGFGVPQDFKESMHWFERAADAGDNQAANALGDVFFEGTLAPKNYQRAYQYYSRAITEPNAHFHLGLMLFNGYGVPIDYRSAFREFKLAALPPANNLRAQVWLGHLYDVGQGTPQDFVMAYMWFNIAAIDGDVEAIKFRDEERAKLTPQQLAEAQKKARTCFEKPLDEAILLCTLN